MKIQPPTPQNKFYAPNPGKQKNTQKEYYTVGNQQFKNPDYRPQENLAVPALICGLGLGALLVAVINKVWRGK